MLKLSCAAAAVAAVVFAAPTAGAAEPVRFTFDVPCSAQGARAMLNTEVLTDSLRTLSFRAIRGVRATVPSDARGQRVGVLNVGAGTTVKRYPLRVPRAGRTSLTLLRQDALRVELRPGAPTFLTVSGLPIGTKTAFITFEGRGKGLLAARDGARRFEIRLTAYRHEGRSVTDSGGLRCA